MADLKRLIGRIETICGKLENAQAVASASGQTEIADRLGYAKTEALTALRQADRALGQGESE